MLRNFARLFSSDLALNIGRDHTSVYARGRGIVVSEPSRFFVNKSTNEVESFGNDFHNSLLSSHNVVAIRPIEDGVLSNFDIIAQIIQYYIRKAHNGKAWMSPNLLISTPSDLTQAEKYVISECGYVARASEVHLVDDVIAAAIGVGLPITEPYGNFLVHIDHATTSVALISYSAIINLHIARVGVEDMNSAIAQYLRDKYDIHVSETTVEFLRKDLGSALPLSEPLSTEVRGYHRGYGSPPPIRVSDDEVHKALIEPVNAIVNAVRVVLELIPPEMSDDVFERGIVLTGVGALLNNLDRRLSIETGLPVSIAEDPVSAVVLGAGKMLSDYSFIKRVEWQYPPL
jgi:rod shape-determining protein MreB